MLTKKTGKIVLLAEKRKINLYELPMSVMQSVEPKLNEKVYEFLSPIKSVSQKKSYGGTSFSQVKRALKRAKKRSKIWYESFC